MKLKNYLLSLQEQGREPSLETSSPHKHFKSNADVRKWYLGEHKREFYKKLKESK